MNVRLLQEATRLFQANRIAEAGGLYEQVLNENPRDFVALSGLGYVRIHEARWEEAARLLVAAAAVEPRDFNVWYHLSSALYRMGRPPDSLNALERGLGLDPGHVEGLTNRAALLLELGRPNEALVTSETALAFRPDFAFAHVNRGNALAALKRHEEAVAAYDAVLAIEPGHASARENRENALFELRRLSRCPPGFMRRLFDGYSALYDSHMVGTLKYRAHVHLRTLFDRLFPDAMPPMRILDLGSGTGLVGEEFKDLAKGARLDGIDLAPLMIEEAKKRGIYDDLILGDLETVLSGQGPAYDLALAADTMIYIGDLAPAFSGVANRLAPGGHYLFAVEAKEGEGWEQTDTNRFRHSLAYMRGEAERAGLEFLDRMECTLREEGNGPIAGFAVALRKPVS